MLSNHGTTRDLRRHDRDLSLTVHHHQPYQGDHIPLCIHPCQLTYFCMQTRTHLSLCSVYAARHTQQEHLAATTRSGKAATSDFRSMRLNRLRGTNLDVACVASSFRPALLRVLVYSPRRVISRRRWILLAKIPRQTDQETLVVSYTPLYLLGPSYDRSSH